MLVEIFGRDAVIAPLGFPRQRDVPLEYLVGAAADLDVGAVAVEVLISLRLWWSWLLLEWPVAVIPAARRPI